MTLTASPPIKASDINVELGRSGTAAFDINGASERALAGVASGAIKFSDFLGKASNSVSYIGKYLIGSGSAPSASISIGTASAARRVVVAVHWGESTAHRSLSSATIGGVAATIHVQAGHFGGATGLGVALISATVPTGTTATLALNFSGSVNSVNVGVWAMEGFDTVVDTGNTQSSVTTAALSLTLSTSAGGVVIGAYTGSTLTHGTGVTWSSITEQYDYDASVRESGAHVSGVSAGTLTFGASQGVISDAGNDMVGVSWTT